VHLAIEVARVRKVVWCGYRTSLNGTYVVYGPAADGAQVECEMACYRQAMSNERTIRVATNDDAAAIRAIAIGTGLFDEESWPDVDSVLQDSVAGELEHHTWLVLEDEQHQVVGATYYAPEPFANRMWNMYFLGVLPGKQGSGSGGTLVTHVENVLRLAGERVLIIETSSVESFEPTRAFYQKLGYTEEARIREFYGPHDDKVVFWKALYA
jgi:ribosomal protein S18 acetylase RimI-like enzyme